MGWGMLVQGIATPSFNTYKLLHALGPSASPRIKGLRTSCPARRPVGCRVGLESRRRSSSRRDFRTAATLAR